jgi:hypothetical protein
MASGSEQKKMMLDTSAAWLYGCPAIATPHVARKLSTAVVIVMKAVTQTKPSTMLVKYGTFISTSYDLKPKFLNDPGGEAFEAYDSVFLGLPEGLAPPHQDRDRAVRGEPA